MHVAKVADTATAFIGVIRADTTEGPVRRGHSPHAPSLTLGATECGIGGIDQQIDTLS